MDAALPQRRGRSCTRFRAFRHWGALAGALLRGLVIGAMITAALPARAETGVAGAHLELGPGFALGGWQKDALKPGVSLRAGAELTLAPWVGIEASLLYGFLPVDGDRPGGYTSAAGVSATYLGIGARFRPLNDEGGYLMAWGRKPGHTGNLWGNLWLSLDVGYVRTGALNRFGASAAVGYEFSLVNAVQLGPFARIFYIPQPNLYGGLDADDAWILSFGLSATIAIPPGIRALPDLDGDGLFEPRDECPRAPEDVDGFEDANGCPDPDDDGDGNPDDRDGCQRAAEDLDGFEDADGCPDRDNDRDGVLDSGDACPYEPEDPDGFEDTDGCPDPDNDGDGVLDLGDECPDQDEVVNGLEDDDGCPDAALVEVVDREIRGGDKIFFDFGLARLKSQSRPVLEQLARLLKTHPEYAKVVLRGHTDATGPPEVNARLSQLRAERVKEAVVALGVDPNRLEAEGVGASEPWKTGGGEIVRAQNRRVEIYIAKIVDPSTVESPAPPQCLESVDGAKPSGGGRPRASAIATPPATSPTPGSPSPKASAASQPTAVAKPLRATLSTSGEGAVETAAGTEPAYDPDAPYELEN